jgi:hypothetical protein
VLSERKYIDPTPLLDTLVDKEGNPLHKGAQEDPTGKNSLLHKLFFIYKHLKLIAIIL